MAGGAVHVRPRGRRRGRRERIGEGPAPVGDGRLATFAVVDADGRDRARLMTSPFSRGAIPFATPHYPVTTPPTAFLSAADAGRLEDGTHVRLRVAGEFVRRRERNVIADGRGSRRAARPRHGALRLGLARPRRDRQRERRRGRASHRRAAPRPRRDARRLRGRGEQAARFALLRRRGEDPRRAPHDRGRGEPRLHRARVTADAARVARRAARALVRGCARARPPRAAMPSRPGRRPAASTPTGSPTPACRPRRSRTSPTTSTTYPKTRRTLLDERLLEDAVDLATALAESQLDRPVPRRE